MALVPNFQRAGLWAKYVSPTCVDIKQIARIAIQDLQSNGKPYASPENKGEGNSFIEEMGVQRGFCKQRVHWMKLGFQNVVAFLWLSYNSLSLAEWLPGKKKIFFLPTGVVEQKHLPVRDGKYISSHLG